MAPTTLTRPAGSPQYQPASALRGPWERELVRRGYSTSEGGAYQRLLRDRAALVRVAHAARASGSAERMMAFLAPVEAAALADVTPDFDSTVLRAENEADGEQDADFDDFLMTRTPEARKRALRSIYAHIARLRVLARSLEAEA